ncbi:MULTISPECIES: ASCH domain-containing protein [unclassified Streptomyces]|uniref:ASCH domain-containing protein n=1 Tax=unclassified Streptomyces TaxID=2593676 RepID=UPI002E33C377|nr:MULTISPECIES: ASCH domain-containing protein [unclassified Streptomyces]WUC68245.1 ASCH domain-containing protein [Streptomyces sp. NBC_00539]
MGDSTSWQQHSTATQTLYFHRDYLDAVRAERKTTTIRFRDPVETGSVSLVFELDDEVALSGVVTQVTAMTVAELSESDARADGFRDLAELHDKLRFHYPQIQPTDTIAIVHFQLVK